MQVSARGCVKCGSRHCGERCLETTAEEEARFEAAVQERLAQRLQEGFMDRTERNCKDQEAEINNNGAAIRNLEIQSQKLSRQVVEEYQISPLSEEVLSIEEQDEERQIEEEGTCELIEEIYAPQALEEDEEEEAPEEASEIVIELECEKMVVERKEQVVECKELKEVPIVDFVFGDKLMIDEEKPPSIGIYLMNSWSKGVQGKEQE